MVKYAENCNKINEAYKSDNIYVVIGKHFKDHDHYNHGVLTAPFPLSLSHYLFLLIIAFGISSKRHALSSQSPSIYLLVK